MFLQEDAARKGGVMAFGGTAHVPGIVPHRPVSARTPRYCAEREGEREKERMVERGRGRKEGRERERESEQESAPIFSDCTSSSVSFLNPEGFRVLRFRVQGSERVPAPSTIGTPQGVQFNIEPP